MINTVKIIERFSRNIFDLKKIRSFEEKLLLNESKSKSLNGFLKRGIIAGAVFAIVLMIAGYYLNLSTDKFVALGIAGFFAPVFLNYLFQDIMFEQRKRKKEELLPDLLLEASVFCDETSVLKMIKRFSEEDFGLLKKDFERLNNEISKGSGVEEALLRMKELNKSRDISRMIDVIMQGYKSGAPMSESMKETAEDFLEAQGIFRERQAAMLVTRYTLLLASALIVPAIIGVLIGLIGGMNFDSMGELSLGLSPAERKELFSFAVLGANLYVIEYALLSSFFLALQEGNKKNFWVFAMVLLPIALTAFYLAQTLW
ncbi:MAG: type II secretion system F family protein [archaeon]